MPPSTGNTRIRQVYRELGNIVNNGGLAARLPQSLLDRLRAMLGILLEELNSPGETDSDGDFLPAELSQGAGPESSAARSPTESPQLSGVHS
jgi:hypothetical protein